MDFTETFEKTIARYDGVITSTRLDQATMPNGAKVFREVVEHPGGVTILPVDHEGFCYCVWQYRYAFQSVLLEAPAGKLETGENPAVCAQRELSEETGIEAKKLLPLGSFYPSPGFCSEVLHLYLAQDLSFHTAHPDENELLEVQKIHYTTLYQMALDGEIPDAKTNTIIFRASKYLRGENSEKNSPYCG